MPSLDRRRTTTAIYISCPLVFSGNPFPGFGHPKMLGCDLAGHVVFGLPNARIIALTGVVTQFEFYLDAVWRLVPVNLADFLL
jgi:hypothetical protein